MPAASPALGRRIAVVGTSGCGKTYVAEALARRLAIPYICNDAIIWRPGWQPAPYEERVAEIDEATNAAAWTFDGNLAARHLDDQIVLSRCDTLVWLDLPRWQVWSQVVRRTLARVVTREELWHGNKESLQMMLSADSIIWWSVRSFAGRRRAYAQLFTDPAYAGCARIWLRSRRQVDRWLASIPVGEPSI